MSIDAAVLSEEESHAFLPTQNSGEEISGLEDDVCSGYELVTVPFEIRGDSVSYKTGNKHLPSDTLPELEDKEPLPNYFISGNIHNTSSLDHMVLTHGHDDDNVYFTLTMYSHDPDDSEDVTVVAGSLDKLMEGFEELIDDFANLPAVENGKLVKKMWLKVLGGKFMDGELSKRMSDALDSYNPHISLKYGSSLPRSESDIVSSVDSALKSRERYAVSGFIAAD